MPAPRGRLLLEELRRTRFAGVSGEVTFDQSGDRLVAHELLNMHADGGAVIAADFSPSSSDFSFQRDLVWMDGLRRTIPDITCTHVIQAFTRDELSGQCRLCQLGQDVPGRACRSTHVMSQRILYKWHRHDKL